MWVTNWPPQSQGSDFDPSGAFVPTSYPAALVVPPTTTPITSNGVRRWVGTLNEYEEIPHRLTRSNDRIDSVLRTVIFEFNTATRWDYSVYQFRSKKRSRAEFCTSNIIWTRSPRSTMWTRRPRVEDVSPLGPSFGGENETHSAALLGSRAEPWARRPSILLPRHGTTHATSAGRQPSDRFHPHLGRHTGTASVLPAFPPRTRIEPSQTRGRASRTRDSPSSSSRLHSIGTLIQHREQLWSRVGCFPRPIGRRIVRPPRLCDWTAVGIARRHRRHRRPRSGNTTRLVVTNCIHYLTILLTHIEQHSQRHDPTIK